MTITQYKNHIHAYFSQNERKTSVKATESVEVLIETFNDFDGIFSKILTKN